MNFEGDKLSKSPEKTDPGSSRQQLRQAIPEAKKKSRKAIGNYTYHEDHVIGWGYTSKVYKGKSLDKVNPLIVAIKKISITNLDNLHMSLLQNEVRIVKKLKHPNVVVVHDILYTKKNCYIIMELCEGGSLQKQIKEIDTLAEKIKIITDLCAAIKYLVSIGVVHRDIKPGNILRSQNGQWKLADFGFATDISHALKDNKVSVGTPIYMAPQSLDIRKYSFKSDIFSLGVVFYQILNKGKLLWFQKTKKKILESILEFNFKQITAEKPFNKSFLVDMLQPNPEERLAPENLSIEAFLNMGNQASYAPKLSLYQNLYDKSLRTDEMLQMSHIISLILNDQMLLEQQDIGLQLYSALKIQRQAIILELQGFSRSSARNQNNRTKSSFQKHKIAKFNNPHSFQFINYTHDLAAKIILKIPSNIPKLSFNLKNFDSVNLSQQKVVGRFAISPTNQSCLTSPILILRKNLMAYREFQQKILNFCFNQSSYVQKSGLRKVTSDMGFRTLTMQIS